MQVRPFFDSLMNTADRLGEMDRQGVDREVLSVWTDIFGYDLPVTKGAAWHATLNDSLARVCDAYLTRFFYDTILHHGPALRYLRDLAGIERMLLGSDLPFPPGDPDPLTTLRDAAFSDAEIEQIVDINPRRLFRL